MPLAGKEPYIFSDKGFSGANLNRPGFKELLSLAESGELDRIIIYRLDRISRSLIDFVLLTDKLKKLGVTLISRTEGFDTSSETGIVLLNILMMFAEMERGAIRRRVTDNYHARARLGLYLGGYAPLGYDKKETFHLGYKTAYFVKNSDAYLVEKIYRLYTHSLMSINAIAAHLNDNGFKGRRGGGWTASSVRRILRSPTYVMADADTYDFLSSQGCNIHSDKASFDGTHGLIGYSSRENRRGAKHTSFYGENISIGLHDGIIPSELWLEAQRRRYTPSFITEKSTPSWLQGVMKCSCGYSFYTKAYRNRIYLCCRGRKLHLCNDKPCVTADELERIIAPLICERLRALEDRHGVAVASRSGCAGRSEALIELEDAKRRVEASSGDFLTAELQRLESLKRRYLVTKNQPATPKGSETVNFSELDFDLRRRIVTLLIARIEISSDTIKLIWR